MAENKFVNELCSLTNRTITAADLLLVEDVSAVETKGLAYSYLMQDMANNGVLVSVKAYGAVGDGSTDDSAAIQAAADAVPAGGVLYFPSTTSSYCISAAIDIDQADNVTIRGENGATVLLTGSGYHGLNISKNSVRVVGLTMQGSGTYVTSGSSGKALIYCTGTDVRIERCYLKEPEQAGIWVAIAGSRATLVRNTIEGGKYFADAAAIDDDRQHYGILIYGDGHKVIGNTCKPNAETNAGSQIQSICGVSITDSVIAKNIFKNPWQHCVYVIATNTAFVGNVCSGGGLKVDMLDTATDGNTIVANVIYINRPTAPLAGDNGIALNTGKYTVIGLNKIVGARDYGIVLNSTTATDTIDGVSIIGNTIDTVLSSSDGVGICLSSVNTCRNVVISGNVIRNCGSSTTGIGAGISTKDLNDTDAHTGIVISDNEIYDSYEVALYLSHLTGAVVSGNYIQGVGVEAAQAAVYLDDVQHSSIRNNTFFGDGSTMDYAFRDSGTASSGYNVIESNTWYNLATAGVRQLNFSTTSTVRNNTYTYAAAAAIPSTSSYSTAGARTIAWTDLASPIHLRDPNGAARTDTTTTAAVINARLLFYNGASMELLYVNTGSAGEDITIAGGTGVTVYNQDMISPGCAARLLFVRDSSTTVKLFVTAYEEVG